MKRYEYLRALPLLLSLMFIGGCAKYDVQRLKRPVAPVREKREIEVISSMMSERECKEAFGGRRVISRGYQPIQLYIKNNSGINYTLNPSDITLPIEHTSNIKRLLHRNACWKALKYTFWLGPIWGLFEGFASEESNSIMHKDIDAKCINPGDVELLGAWSVFNKLILIPNEEITNSYKITLIEEGCNNKLGFKI